MDRVETRRQMSILYIVGRKSDDRADFHVRGVRSIPQAHERIERGRSQMARCRHRKGRDQFRFSQESENRTIRHSDLLGVDAPFITLDDAA